MGTSSLPGMCRAAGPPRDLALPPQATVMPSLAASLGSALVVGKEGGWSLADGVMSLAAKLRVPSLLAALLLLTR